ncbi:hypothetical protein NGTWS1803_27950 [Mycolicibacterium cyprinidarum]|nr:hypothetical protein NGTWS1803_27950 [Mycolicibacterium sp. NGTWS1803]
MRVNRARKTTVAVGLRARFVLIGVLLVACQSQQQEPDVTAPPPPVVRHDIEPLIQIFPALGTPVSAAWITWGNAAETSKLQLEWIDAVVRVTPATMNAFVTQHESEDTKQRPAVQKVLEPDVPAGPFQTGVELNMLFGAERRSTRVFLDPPRDTVVLQSSLAG